MESEFGELVRVKRASNYRTAKDFYREKPLSCTYAYYSKVENGTVPEIRIALEIIDKLGLNSRKALYAWTRDLMPSSETKSFFSEIDDQPSLSSEQKSMDRSVVVNRMQARLLLKNPLYWELVIYISTYNGKKEFTAKDIAKEFGMKASEVEKHLAVLYDNGLLDKSNQGNYISKEWTFIPYDDEFKPLRNLNFKRAFEQFMKSEPTSQFRTTITCPLLPRHQKVIESKILALTNFIIDLSERESTADSEAYSIGIFTSPGRFGDE